MKITNFIFLLVLSLNSLSQTFERSFRGGLVPNLTMLSGSVDKSGKIFAFLNNKDGDPVTPEIFSIFHIDKKGDSIWEKIVPVQAAGINQLEPLAVIKFGSNYVFSSMLHNNLPWKYLLGEMDSLGTVVSTRTTQSSVAWPTIIESHSGNHFYSIYTNHSQQPNLVWNYFMKIDKHAALNTIQQSIVLNRQYPPQTPSLHGQYFLNFALPTLDDGLLLSYKFDNFQDSSFVTKFNSNGTIHWHKKLSTIIGQTASIWGAFKGNDSTYYLCAADFVPNLIHAQVILIRLDKNGNILSSFQTPTNVNLFNGVYTSNNKLMYMYYTLNNNYNPISSVGIAVCNNDFSNIKYYPMPFNSTNFIFGNPIVSNDYGGGRIAFREPGNQGLLNGFTVLNFDSLLNTYPHKVIINSILDNDKNCSVNIGDKYLKNTTISLKDSLNNIYYAFSDPNGNYKLNIPFNTYTLSYTPYGYKNYECPGTNTLIINGTSPSTLSSHILYDTIIPNIKDLNIMLAGNWLSQSETTTLYALVKNDGTMPVSGTVQIKLDTCMQFVSSSPSIISNVNNVLTFSVNNVLPDTLEMLSFSFNLSQTAPIGLPVKVIGNAFCSGDADLSNNTDTLGASIYPFLKSNQEIFNKNNSIIVTQPEFVNDDEALVYRIKYQNALNDYCKDLLIIDSIDNHLDIGTLKIQYTTHTITEIKHRKSNRLDFKFENINLPDRANSDSLSKGEIIYSIKFKEGVFPGTKIRNFAQIYFDYKPIITNATENILRANVTRLPTKLELENNLKIFLYPNPATKFVKFKNLVNASKSSCSIYNIQGNLVKQDLNLSNELIDVSELTDGIYFVKLFNNSTTYNFKLIIAR